MGNSLFEGRSYSNPLIAEILACPILESIKISSWGYSSQNLNMGPEEIQVSLTNTCPMEISH